MKARSVRIGPQAANDIRRIGNYIANSSGPAVAEHYVERLFAFVARLDLATERGIDKSDIRQGLRLVAFERSANLALLVRNDTAIVVRVFYRGRDWERALRHQFGKPS